MYKSTFWNFLKYSNIVETEEKTVRFLKNISSFEICEKSQNEKVNGEEYTTAGL